MSEIQFLTGRHPMRSCSSWGTRHHCPIDVGAMRGSKAMTEVMRVAYCSRTRPSRRGSRSDDHSAEMRRCTFPPRTRTQTQYTAAARLDRLSHQPTNTRPSSQTAALRVLPVRPSVSLSVYPSVCPAPAPNSNKA